MPCLFFFKSWHQFQQDKPPFVLVPALKPLQMHRPWLRVLRDCLTRRGVASWRCGYASGPKLENLDQDKRKQMPCQPLAILVPAVAAPGQNEDSHSPAPCGPYNRTGNRISLSI